MYDDNADACFNVSLVLRDKAQLQLLNSKLAKIATIPCSVQYEENNDFTTREYREVGFKPFSQSPQINSEQGMPPLILNFSMIRNSSYRETISNSLQ